MTELSRLSAFAAEHHLREARIAALKIAHRYGFLHVSVQLTCAEGIRYMIYGAHRAGAEVEAIGGGDTLLGALERFEKDLAMRASPKRVA